MSLLLKQAQVWHNNRFEQLDVLLEYDTVSRLEADIPSGMHDVRYLKDSFILPGCVDMHVHVGEKIGGYTLADSYASIRQLCDKTGINGIGAFITRDKAFTSLSAQYQVYQEQAESAGCPVLKWHITPSFDDVEDVLALSLLNCDIKLYTTYKEAGIFSSYEDIERWMQLLQDIKPLLLIHCEEDDVIRQHSASPYITAYDHTLRRPEEAELKAVDRVLNLAAKHSYPVHIVHVSSPQAALLIQSAKGQADVSCETAIHYLLLNDSYLKRPDGHRWLCSPPLRSENSRGMLCELLQDGVIDVIASDHCPFTMQDKDRYADNPEQVPKGIAGLGSSFSLLYKHFVQAGKLSLSDAVKLTSVHPAKRMGAYPQYGDNHSGYTGMMLILPPDGASREYALPSLSYTPNPFTDFSALQAYQVLNIVSLC